MRTAQLLLLSLFLTSAASAQTFEQLAWMRLNDTTPRTTRAVALGGASDSLGDADMAANPATLINVKRATVSVQGARNSLDRMPFIGVLPPDYSNWTYATGLSQVAAAIPAGNFAAGVYYASEPRLQSATPLVTSFGGAPYAALQCRVRCDYVSLGADPPFDRSDRRYGIALAWERGPIAIGAGAERQRLYELSEPLRIGAKDGGPPSQIERVFRRVDGSAVVANAGLRWRVTPRFAVAAAYNGAGTFTRTTSACNASADFTACSSAAGDLATTTVHQPDAYRASLSFAATARLRVVAEEVRRKYGKLAYEPSEVYAEGDHPPYHDVTELHAGAEYKLASVFLRTGWWRDPSRFASPDYVARERVEHRTFGAGIDVGKARLDLAYDHASQPLQRRAVVGLGFGL